MYSFREMNQNSLTSMLIIFLTSEDVNEEWNNIKYAMRVAETQPLGKKDKLL